MVRPVDPVSMTDNVVYFAGPRSDFVELARTPMGRVFRKQILHFGTFAHPNDKSKKLVVDAGVANHLVENFRNGVCDIVQVPIVNDGNHHVEDPLRNIGEVIDLEVEPGKGVFAVIDARKEAESLGKTLIGASAMMHMDYTDTRSGKHVGPTLLHVAVTNRPYITNLDNFQEIIAASADSIGKNAPVLFTESGELDPDQSVPDPEVENEMMTLDEMIAALNEEHGIDVLALQQQAGTSNAELVSAMSAVLKDAGVVSLSGQSEDDLTVEDVANAVVELSQERVELAEQISSLQETADELRLTAAEKEIDTYVSGGYILPTQRDGMLELRLTNQEMFTSLLPADPIVSLSEDGVTTHEEASSEVFEKTQKDIDRLVELSAKSTGRKRG
jgi:hypothetical protein